MPGVGVRGVGVTGGIGLTARIASLFRSGEQGVWYDPSDRATLFQDAAGTTPVTAIEQPVGLMLDKSGRGNHAYQSTSASRPVLSARVNLLTKTDDFSHGGWTKVCMSAFGSGSVANAIANPITGDITADLLTEDTATGGHYVYQPIGTVGLQYRWHIFAKSNGRSIALTFGGDSVIASFNLTNGTVVSGTGAAITPIGSGGWYLCTGTGISNATNLSFALSKDDGTVTYAGDGTSGVYVWGADIRVANDGVNLPPYQRVNTATDYDAAGFPRYLRFDGVDDFLVTNSIDFTATDKMTVVTGVRKLSDASAAMVAELSSNWWANNGTFALSAPQVAMQNHYNFLSKGTVAQSRTFNTFTSPITNTVTGVGDISGPGVGGSVNGVQFGQVMSTQGTGNYGNYPLYIGSRAGSSLRFNGHIYSLIIRGAASSAKQIAATEKWTNQKTKAYA